jgi:hypothetical protein
MLDYATSEQQYQPFVAYWDYLGAKDSVSQNHNCAKAFTLNLDYWQCLVDLLLPFDIPAMGPSKA